MKEPTVTFISNFRNHYQLDLGNAFAEAMGDRFRFAFLGPIDDERKRLGWADSERASPYAINSWESTATHLEMRRAIDHSDVVVLGAGSSNLVRERILRGGLTFLWQERLWKKGVWRIIDPRVIMRLHRDFLSLNRLNYHLLAAGAFTAPDFSIFGAFPGRKWKWGYFPEVVEELPKRVDRPRLQILWAGRFLDWKCVEDIVQAAARLRALESRFEITLVGDGDHRSAIERLISAQGLQRSVKVYGAVPPRSVLEIMDHTDVYVLPSNRAEGWGVVCNEAMSRGCCLVVSDKVGAAPWLVKHGRSGFIYSHGNIDQLSACLGRLIVNRTQCRDVARAGFESLRAGWTPALAASRFLQLATSLLAGDAPPVWDSGPCSRA